MRVTYWKKSERAAAFAAAEGRLKDVEAKAREWAAKIAAARDPYGSEERNRLAMGDVRRKAEADLLTTLAAFRAPYERALAAAALETRAAHLRKAGLGASPGAVALLAAMPEEVFAVTLREAAARGDAETVGAGLALGRTLGNASLARQVSEAVEGIELPEQVEAETQLRTIRDAYLRAEVAVREVTRPGDAAAARLTLGRALEAPLVEA